MKYKTSELTGALLDAAVAKAEGFDLTHGRIVIEARFDHETRLCDNRPGYSTDWSQGGQIIEREGIQLGVDKRSLSVAAGLPEWDAVIGEYFGLMRDAGWESIAHTCGPTPLIAAMRCYVTSKFGEEVDLPD